MSRDVEVGYDELGYSRFYLMDGATLTVATSIALMVEGVTVERHSDRLAVTLSKGQSWSDVEDRLHRAIGSAFPSTHEVSFTQRVNIDGEFALPNQYFG